MIECSPAPSYPPSLAIEPAAQPVDMVPRIPGSKSITNRALILGALAGGGEGCELRRILRSEDTEVMMSALVALGFDIQSSPCQDSGAAPDALTVRIRRPDSGRIFPASSANLFVGNSGTSMRFLTALVALGRGRYRIDGIPRMRERPIEDLLDALRQLGVNAQSEAQNGCPPVVIESAGLPGGRVRIRGSTSSQFLSGLLMAAPLAAGALEIEVEGALVSQPYVAMTVALMRQFGARLTATATGYRIPGGQTYTARSLTIEPDASAASYFFGAAAITRGRVLVPGLGRDSLQGDLRFADVLQAMGCEFRETAAGLELRGGSLRGIDVDMNDISDCVMTLAAVACFADGPTAIRNVAHIRHKETDRLSALATELRRVGAGVQELADGLVIQPAPLHGAAVETYNDHRMAMSLALLGLRVPGIVILNPACVAKTYPRFFEDFQTRSSR